MSDTSLLTLAGLEEYGGLLKEHLDSYLSLLYEKCKIQTTITKASDNSKTITENFYNGSDLKAIRAVVISSDGATLTETITLKGAGTDGADVVKTRTWTASGSTILEGVFASD